MLTLTAEEINEQHAAELATMRNLIDRIGGLGVLRLMDDAYEALADEQFRCNNLRAAEASLRAARASGELVHEFVMRMGCE